MFRRSSFMKTPKKFANKILPKHSFRQLVATTWLDSATIITAIFRHLSHICCTEGNPAFMTTRFGSHLIPPHYPTAQRKTNLGDHSSFFFILSETLFDRCNI